MQECHTCAFISCRTAFCGLRASAMSHNLIAAEKSLLSAFSNPSSCMAWLPLLEQAATTAYRIKREHQIITFSFWTCSSLSSAVRSGSTLSSGSANAAAGASTFLLFAILKDTDILPNIHCRTFIAGHLSISRNAPTAKPSVSFTFSGQTSQLQSRPGHQRWQTVNFESRAEQLQAAASAQWPNAM